MTWVTVITFTFDVDSTTVKSLSRIDDRTIDTYLAGKVENLVARRDWVLWAKISGVIADIAEQNTAIMLTNLYCILGA